MMRLPLPAILLLSTLSAVLMVGCEGGGDQGREIKLAHVLTDRHPVHKAMVRMAELVNGRTDGKLTIDIRHSAQLGAEKELIEKVQSGQIQMTKVSSNALESVTPAMGVFTLPWLFRGEEHYEKALRSQPAREILDKLQEQGLKGLVYYDAGARSFYARRPIEGIGDLQGLKIRVQNSPTMIATMRALGAVPVSIPFGAELTQALEKGQLVTAAENNIPSYETEEHYRSCSHFYADGHSRAPDVLVMNLKAWRSLSPEEQDALQTAADESADYQFTLWDRTTAELKKKLQDKGVTFTEPDTVEPFQRAVEEVYQKLPDWKKKWVRRLREVK
ncbi:MAG: TRAP transporter substrate-binding protein [Planctomycetota bacterium]